MKTILVVEDSENIRRLCEAALVSAGYRVVTAENASVALGLLTDACDLVLSDNQMPGGISGLQLFSVVRKRFPHMPFILMSGEVCAFETGARCAFLKKPFLIQQLQELAAHMLE